VIKLIDKDEVTKQINMINNKINKAVQEFSNINISLCVEDVDSEANHTIGLKLKTISTNKQLNESIGLEISESMLCAIKYHIDDVEYVSKRMLDNIIEDISLNILFKRSLLESEEYDKLLNFVKFLQELSVKTYECSFANIGIFIFDETHNIEKMFESLQIEYINFEKKLNIEYVINNEKPLIKLIDSKSFALVLDKDFNVIGFARKMSECKSIDNIILNDYFTKVNNNVKNYIIKWIEDILKRTSWEFPELEDEIANRIISHLETSKVKLESVLNEYPIVNEFENVKYIRIVNTEIQWYFNKNFIITLKNGKWKLKHFILLSSYIFEFLNLGIAAEFALLQETSDLINAVNSESEKIFKLISIIRDMAEKNIGGLFVILNKAEDTKEINKNNLLDILPNGLINNKNKENWYKSLIYDENGECKNMVNIDGYILTLIAGIDGATILDHNLNILTYGEIINNKNSDTSKNIFGARTNAAISASEYGLAIKVSEDGDIELYKSKDLVFKI